MRQDPPCPPGRSTCRRPDQKSVCSSLIWLRSARCGPSPYRDTAPSPPRRDQWRGAHPSSGIEDRLWWPSSKCLLTSIQSSEPPDGRRFAVKVAFERDLLPLEFLHFKQPR